MAGGGWEKKKGRGKKQRKARDAKEVAEEGKSMVGCFLNLSVLDD